MSNIPAMYNRGTDGSITGVTFYLDFVPYQADASNPNFSLLLEELKSAEPDHAKLVAATKPIEAVKQAVADAVSADYLPAGVVGVTANQITYNGEPVKGVLVDRILAGLAEGFDIMPTVRFLENVYLNPATYSRDELYLWLENSNLPITADGHFLAYKNVRSDFRSYHGGEVDNTPGLVPQMDRRKVNPDRYQTCEAGLHFCSQSYLNMYTSNAGNRVVLLKINPADVVSIPSDYNNAKGRAWKYEVLREVEDPYADSWKSYVSDSGDDYDPDTDDDSTYEDAIDPNDDFWADDDENIGEKIRRSLLGDLFAAYNAIAEDRTDRDTRLDWATEWLSTEVVSFNDLEIWEIERLIDAAEEEAADRAIDMAAAEALDVLLNAPDPQLEALLAEEDEINAKADRLRQIDAINSLGIIKLRKLTKKWKGYKAEALRQILIDQIDA